MRTAFRGQTAIGCCEPPLLIEGATGALLVQSAPPTSGSAGTAAAIAAVNAAPDRTKAYTYLDEGTADERLETVTVASAALGLSYTTTYTYAGSAGNYRLTSEARS